MTGKRKYLPAALLAALLCLCAGCGRGEKTGISFDLDGTGAVYRDYDYRMTVRVPEVSCFEIQFPVPDADSATGSNGDRPPERSLLLRCRSYEKDGRAEDLGSIVVTAWVSHASPPSYCDAFTDVAETEWEMEDGVTGYWKQKEENGRVRVFFYRENEHCQLEADLAKGAFDNYEEWIREMCLSLRADSDG